MRLPEEPEKPLSLNLVPMIDVIFAILAFFILSTLYLTRSEGLPVNLPNATTSQTQPQNPITVTINDQGAIFINQTPTDLNQLNQGVQALQGQTQGENTLVLVNADQSVPHGQVVTVMDSLRQIQGIQLAIAVQKP